MATKPSGAPLGSKAKTTPTAASGATAHTRKSSTEALQLDHQDRGHDKKHQWNDALDRALALGALLDCPSDCDRVATRQPFCEAGHARRKLLDYGVRLHVVANACLQGDRGEARPTPYRRLLNFIAQRSNGAEGHGLAPQADKLQVP